MAKLRARASDPRQGESGLPWPLSEGATVEHYAPEVYAAHGGIEPGQRDPAWWSALMVARSEYRRHLERWCADQGLTVEQRRAVPSRRPRWS